MRCEAILSPDYLRIDNKADTRCRRVAAYLFARKSLCPEHASMALLEVAKITGTIKRLTRTRGEKEYRDAVGNVRD